MRIEFDPATPSYSYAETRVQWQRRFFMEELLEVNHHFSHPFRFFLKIAFLFFIYFEGKEHLFLRESNK